MVRFHRPVEVFRNAGRSPAFTLLELVIVMAITGLLATLAIPALEPLRDRAEKMVCVGNLRSIYISLNAYLTDHQSWPQCPVEVDRAGAEKFWTETLLDYGATPKVWICPTLKRRFASQPKGEVYPKIHYIPAQFDEKPFTPRKWAAMPWAIEVGNMHGAGSLLIRSDGGVKEMNRILEEAGASNGPVSVHQLQ